MKLLILSTPDVQSIISGNKGRHSVLAKDVPNHDHHGTKILDWGLSKHPWCENGVWKYRQQTAVDDSRLFEIKSPFGSPGDQEWQTGMPPVDGMYWVDGFGYPLYCRIDHPNEIWLSISLIDRLRDVPAEEYPETIRWKRMGTVIYAKEKWRPDLAGHDVNDFVEYIRYAADDTRLPIKWKKDYPTYNYRSGAVMPPEYSRIFLEITDVTCKRVQDITEEEAIEEGVEKINESIFCWKHYGGKDSACIDAKTSYRTLYEERHGPDSWNNNDFVFSASFKVLSVNGKPSYL